MRGFWRCRMTDEQAATAIKHTLVVGLISTAGINTLP